MTYRSRAALFLVPSLVAVACGGGGSNGSTSTSTGTGGHGGAAMGGLPCDVSMVFEGHCQQCHDATPVFGAPMPLVTYADLVAPAKSDPTKKVYELVEKRIHDDSAPMPQPPNPRLGAADLKTLDDWIAGGAQPVADGSCSGTSSTGTGGMMGASCTPDTNVVPASPYTMPQDATDMYICYGVDIAVSQKTHITAFLPKVDNAKIVHHILLFQADSTQPAGPVSCGFGGTNTRLIGVWAPGNDGFVLPPEAGFPIEGTAHYLLQVHYNNLNHLAGEQDASGFSLCTTTTLRPNDADVLAFGTESFSIPAHGTLDVTCDFQIPAGVGSYHVIGGMPHMHKLGTVISTVNKPSGGGGPVDLGTRNPWDFNAQYWTTLDAVVKPGDTVSTRCAWNNQGNTTVKFGENTEDEMCFSFALYYPAITAAQWNWAVPSFLSKCSPTP